MKVLQTPSFARVVKKLHPNEKAALDKAIRFLLKSPESGPMKTGDLAGIRVHKHKLKGQQYLLAYTYDKRDSIITLIALGTHENFYRDMKQK